jgi:heat shock protein HslJ
MRRNGWRTAVAALTAVAVVTVAACGDDEDDPASEPTSSEGSAPATTAGEEMPMGLDGRTFVVTAVEGYQLADGSTVRITFDDGLLVAEGGCNSMRGSYEASDGTLAVGELATTEMACEPDLMAQDEWLASFLSSRPGLELDGATLVLTGDDATLTLTDREVAEPDLDLVGPVWELETIVTADAASSVPGGAVATLTFQPDGTVQVDTSCNTGSATVAVTETQMQFGPLALTRKACDPDRTEVERLIVAITIGPVDYRIESDLLTLSTGTNALQWRARPV